jgi:hypothetical protein
MRPVFPDQEIPPDSTLWHLCWQAAVGRNFLAHPSLPMRIRYRLIDAHEDHDRLLLDFLLLPTEIHVVSALAPGDSPGRLARAVGNVVARWVRDFQPVRSPVLAGPHRATRIKSVPELREQVRMLAWRPVHLKLCRTPTHHSHGSVRVALGHNVAHGFNAWPLLSLFADTVQTARKALRRWLASRPSGEAVRYWELTRGLALASGSVGPQPVMARELRAEGAAALAAAAGPAGIDGALRLLETWVAARLDAKGTLDLQAHGGPLASRGRALVACLSVDHGLCSAASVARHFCRAKATLSERMSACRRSTADQAILRLPITRIIEEGTALETRARARARMQGQHDPAGAGP